MEGIVQIEPLELDRAGGEHPLESLQVAERTGHSQRSRTVFPRDHHGVPVQSGVAQKRLHHTEARANHRHAALAARGFLMQAAIADHAHRRGEVQHSAGPGGRHLAEAVPKHRGGFQSARREGFHKPHLNGENQRLGDLGVRHAAKQLGAFEMGQQRKRSNFLKFRIHSPHGVAEYGVLGVKLSTHSLPLGAVASENKNRLAWLRQGVALEHAGIIRAFGKPAQGLDQRLAIRDENHAAFWQPLATITKHMGHIVKGRIRFGLEESSQSLCYVPQRLLAFRGENKWQRPLIAGLCRDFSFRSRER